MSALPYQLIEYLILHSGEVRLFLSPHFMQLLIERQVRQLQLYIFQLASFIEKFLIYLSHKIAGGMFLEFRSLGLDGSAFGPFLLFYLSMSGLSN